MVTSQYCDTSETASTEASPAMENNGHDETDMTEMLNELRVLLPGAQLLNGFLIALPFNAGFREIVQLEKWIFMATFLCSLSSLILFTAPAVQHRVLRPLEDRLHFKNVASKQMLAGAFFLSLSLVLGTSLVIAEVVGHPAGIGVAAVFASLILALWWLYPWMWKKRQSDSL
jgi:sorbitol-specific phosphotransferase system component IIBC